MFNLGDKVLAYHGPLIYEAKVMKVHRKSSRSVEVFPASSLAPGTPKPRKDIEPVKEANIPANLLSNDAYLLHYKGWKAKWDEWVSEDRIMEHNSENLAAQKELKAATAKVYKLVKQEKMPKKRGNTTVASDKGIKKKKDKVNFEIGLTIQPALKYLLIDDWEFITKDRKLIELPTKAPIESILDWYYHHRLEADIPASEINILKEFIQGLKVYFEKSLSLILLYRFEKLQYLNLLKEYKKKGKSLNLCQVYGVEHLLRLFVVLPGLIAQTSMDAISVGVMGAQCTNFLEYLSGNLSDFVNEYVNVSPAYDRLSRN